MDGQIEVIVHGKFHPGDAIKDRKLLAMPGENLWTVLKKNGCYLQDCNGLGTCGKCKVRFKTIAPIPTANERMHFSAEELRAGYRLACRHTIRNEMEIELVNEPAKLPNVLLEKGIGKPYLRDESAGHHPCEPDEAGVGTRRDGKETTLEYAGRNPYYVAIDIGTTTIAMQAIQEREVLYSYTALNPQRIFGADVASRIMAGMQGHLEEMSEQIKICIRDGLNFFLEQMGNKPEYMVIAGNTTMNYLLRELPVTVLGSYPFSPVDTKLTVIEVCGISAYLIPGVSAFIGGDIVAGILALGMQESQGVSLLLDLGTNGEMILGQKDKLLGTATAAGPAFEGGISSQLMGADLIRITAKLLDGGILDNSGLMQEPYFDMGIRCEGVVVTNQDIRELQKAKAAIAAGIDILLERYGIDRQSVEQIYLAGGFGYYLDPHSAIRIGLLPTEWDGRITAVGNTALAGAGMLGEALYGISMNDREELFGELIATVQQSCSVINLAEEPAFTPSYLEALNF